MVRGFATLLVLCRTFLCRLDSIVPRVKEARPPCGLRRPCTMAHLQAPPANQASRLLAVFYFHAVTAISVTYLGAASPDLCLWGGLGRVLHSYLKCERLGVPALLRPRDSGAGMIPPRCRRSRRSPSHSHSHSPRLQPVARLVVIRRSQRLKHATVAAENSNLDGSVQQPTLLESL